MKGLIEGRMVHYVLRAGRSAGQSRPAVVVRVWNDSGLVNLCVFLDGTNDDGASSWATSVRYSEGNEQGTWHWPPKG